MSFGDDSSTLHQGQRGVQLPEKRTLQSASFHGSQNFNIQQKTHTEQHGGSKAYAQEQTGSAWSKSVQNTESEKE